MAVKIAWPAQKYCSAQYNIVEKMHIRTLDVLSYGHAHSE